MMLLWKIFTFTFEQNSHKYILQYILYYVPQYILHYKQQYIFQYIFQYILHKGEINKINIGNMEISHDFPHMSSLITYDN